mgnify:FL=1|tara:strand:+ start:1748 stop:1993 length:246 start_codon:yes stop_codon:yes gene_type:complete
MARNYRQEYDRYQGTSEQKKARARRNAGRRLMERLGKVSKGDGKDVAHRDNNTKNNKKSNLQVQDASTNRSFARTKKARRK